MNKLKTFIVDKFNALPDKTKIALISAFSTFSSTFLSIVGATLATGQVEWTVAFWSALGLSAVRAGFKSVLNIFVPVKLGGKA
jgi:surface polysaccharide O-acyltransferase-like enzyme